MSYSNILIAEDSEAFREFLKPHIERLLPSAKITIKTNGLEALDSFTQSKPDLIITDTNMPLMNGIRLIQEVRKQDPRVPLILLYSDRVDEEGMSEADVMNCGASLVVSKIEFVKESEDILSGEYKF